MQSETEAWFCYMLRCRDDSLYVGIASNVAARVKKHNDGFGPEFTRKGRPVELVWSQEFANSSAARKREVELKGWNREKKLRLVDGLEKSGGKALGQALRVNPSRGLIAPAQGKGE
jgi:putative endonuclease